MLHMYVRDLVSAYKSRNSNTLRSALNSIRNEDIRLHGMGVSGHYQTMMAMIDDTGEAKSEEGHALFTQYAPSLKLSSLTLAPSILTPLQQFLREQRGASKLYAHDLKPARRMLFSGSPGTGKTMTAKALAAELALPLMHVSQSGIIESHLGNTARNLTTLFTRMKQQRAVYLFDEFDALAKSRGGGDDVAEMNRTVNQILQLLDQDDSDSVLIGTTNRYDLIDAAVRRRFDMVVEYTDPTSLEIDALLKGVFSKLAPAHLPVFNDKVISHAEAVAWAMGLKKEAVLEDKTKVSIEEIRDYYEARAYSPASKEHGVFKLVKPVTAPTDEERAASITKENEAANG